MNAPPPPAASTSFSFRIAPGRPTALLAATAVVLALLGLAVGVARGASASDLPRIVRRFGLDAENSVPAWFTGSLLLLCALSLWTTAGDTAARGERYVWHWRVLALAFAYLSLDEVASLHELANEPVREALDLGGVLNLSWVVVAVPLVALFGLAYLRFLGHLPARTRWLVVAAGAVYVAGAVGLELPGSVLLERGDQFDPGYLVVSTLEELLEMLGAVLLLHALADHGARRAAAAPPRGATAATGAR